MFAAFGAVVFLVVSGTARATDCRYYLADQSASDTKLGFILDLETISADSPVCQLGALNLAFGVGDGHDFRWITVSPGWQAGRTYEVRAVITSAESQLYLDGQLLGTARGSFATYDAPLQAAQAPSWMSGQTDYFVSQSSLQASSGDSSLNLPVDRNTARPLPLQLLAPGFPWHGAFNTQPNETTTLTARFRIDPAVDPHQFDPYIDRYGQSVYGDWPSKVTSDDALRAAITEEQNWLDKHAAPAGLDAFGGSTAAGWQDEATGFYHVTFQRGRWWLITPQGNPTFYLSVAGTGQNRQYTPVTGRESMFAELPPEDAAFSPARVDNAGNEAGGKTTYASFSIANLIRKYGDGWLDRSNDLAVERLRKYGFTGVGKWSDPQRNVPLIRVLTHGDIANLVRHPDIFDPNIRARLRESLARQIGEDRDSPYIVGWSVGSEFFNEIITPGEITSILALGAGVPAKRALVYAALASVYYGNLDALAANWKVSAATLEDVYAAAPAAPVQDVEALRRYYASNYYHILSQVVKSIDPNHLYLGFWIEPGFLVSDEDWRMEAANSDVIGFDYYAPRFLAPNVDALIREANKPVLVGEFGFPAAYDGWRGFGASSYPSNVTSSDAESGDKYAQWLMDASAYPYCIGVSWFEYRDQPVTGRGPGSGPNLVYGENYASGLIDVADRPKYDLVERVRAANLAVLASLGLE